MLSDEQAEELYVTSTSTVVLKPKQEILYVPLDFESNLTVNAFVDSGTYFGAIAQNDLDTIRQKALKNILKIHDAPIFQIQIAKGQLEKPLATATLKIVIEDKIFAEHFVVKKKILGPKLRWHFLRNNSVVIHTTHGLIHFPHLSMQVKNASSETTTKPQPVITDDALTIPPMTRTIKALFNLPLKWNTTGTVTPLEKFKETVSLLISPSMSTKFDKRLAVRVTNATESPYLIKKNSQISELPVVTPDQSKSGESYFRSEPSVLVVFKLYINRRKRQVTFPWKIKFF